MKKYAIVDSLGSIVNVVVSEEREAVDLLFSATNLVVEETNETGPAFIGATYRGDRQKFMPYRPFDTWVFNEESWSWGAPIPMPSDGKFYFWNALTNSWAEASVEEPSE